MKLSSSILPNPFKSLPRYTEVAQQLFADGKELDPETAIIVAGLPSHLLDDIGVTDREQPGNRVDNRRLA